MSYTNTSFGHTYIVHDEPQGIEGSGEVVYKYTYIQDGGVCTPFLTITNRLPMITRRGYRGERDEWPCGGHTTPFGSWCNITDEDRNILCPIIAKGYAAYFVVIWNAVHSEERTPTEKVELRRGNREAYLAKALHPYLAAANEASRHEYNRLEMEEATNEEIQKQEEADRLSALKAHLADEEKMAEYSKIHASEYFGEEIAAACNKYLEYVREQINLSARGNDICTQNEAGLPYANRERANITGKQRETSVEAALVNLCTLFIIKDKERIKEFVGLAEACGGSPSLARLVVAACKCGMLKNKVKLEPMRNALISLGIQVSQKSSWRNAIVNAETSTQAYIQEEVLRYIDELKK